MLKNNRGYIGVITLVSIGISIFMLMMILGELNNALKSISGHLGDITNNNNFNSSIERIEALLTKDIFMFEGEDKVAFEDLAVEFDIVDDNKTLNEVNYSGEILYDNTVEFVVNNTPKFDLNLALVCMGYHAVNFVLLDNKGSILAEDYLGDGIVCMDISNLSPDNYGVYKLCVSGLIDGCKVCYELRYSKVILRALELRGDPFKGSVYVGNSFPDFRMNEISWK